MTSEYINHRYDELMAELKPWHARNYPDAKHFFCFISDAALLSWLLIGAPDPDQIKRVHMHSSVYDSIFGYWPPTEGITNEEKTVENSRYEVPVLDVRRNPPEAVPVNIDVNLQPCPNSYRQLCSPDSFRWELK